MPEKMDGETRTHTNYSCGLGVLIMIVEIQESGRKCQVVKA